MAWVYKNIGLTRLLTSFATFQAEPGYSTVKYGVAYSQMLESACFGVAAASEIWLKFDIFRGGVTKSRAGNGGANGFTGIEFGENANYRDALIYINGTIAETLTATALPGYNMTYWLHLKSGADSGIVEIYKSPWEEIFSYTGNVNNGADFSDIYTYSAQPGQFFSNVIVSDSAISLNENADYLAELTGDTRREVSNTAWPVTITGDTRRDVTQKGTIIFADTSRRLLATIALQGDTERNIENAGYRRITLSADTRRRVANQVEIPGDTKRRIPRIVKTDFQGPPYPSDGITAINLNLQAGTITDTASYGTVIHTLPKEELRGYILDFPYSFICESTTHSGQEQTANCAYDVDRLLYEPFTLEESDTTQAAGFMAALASVMGKTLSFMGNGFIYKQKIGGKNQTYRGLVSSIFGWSNRVPRMQYNVFIRGDRLMVVQRGRETGTVNLDELPESWIASRPTVNRELVRTMTAKNIQEIDGDIGILVKPNVFIDGGDDEYNDEDVVYDTLITPAGETDSRPTSIRRYNADGSYTLIEYSYQWTGTNYVLRSETETTRDADGNFISQSITYHEILAGGWRNSYTVAQDEDGNTIGVGSIGGRTRPGDMTTSAYTDQVKLARGGRWKGTKDALPGGTSLLDTDFPVDDTTALRALNEIYWMNQRIKETVTLDLCPPVVFSVPEYQHIVDFTDRVVYAGSEYFLDRNAVSFTPTGHRQTLSLVRWF